MDLTSQIYKMVIVLAVAFGTMKLAKIVEFLLFIKYINLSFLDYWTAADAEQRRAFVEKKAFDTFNELQTELRHINKRKKWLELRRESLGETEFFRRRSALNKERERIASNMRKLKERVTEFYPVRAA